MNTRIYIFALVLADASDAGNVILPPRSVPVAQ